MAQMTEEEANALDEYYTQNPPRIDPAKKGGFFTRRRELLNVLDGVSADLVMGVVKTSGVKKEKVSAAVGAVTIAHGRHDTGKRGFVVASK